ncbi:hypothetical protein AAFN85_24730 [Mucilaginibacter sp. CAU 1740]|uniref:hypothetical protein n=1 Tax=Mucilaginibacter sp. CAU 1740 TaxID=3140365 RepID=UPI00325C2083
MFQLIRILINIVFYVARQEAKNQAAPQLDPALFQKRSKSISQYIEMASNAMINDGRKPDEVKTMLLGNGLHEDHLDVVIEKAENRYKDWFNENQHATVSVLNTYNELSVQQNAGINEAAVKTISIADEDHALHYSALIGFKRYCDIVGRMVLYAVTNDAMVAAAVIVNGDIAIKQGSFARHGGNEDRLFLRAVAVNNQRQAVYPYLSGSNPISFQSGQITEWVNGDPVIEAEIKGEWNKRLQLCFFATDYAVNKNIYKSGDNINIRLSAFAFDLLESERNNNQLNQEVKGLWPATGYKHPSYFGFEAVILEIKAAAVDKQSIGCIMTLMLVNSGYIPGSDLIIDTYVSNSNIKADKIQKGMLVTGTLWLQGELAD